jgi:hypothetical protein
MFFQPDAAKIAADTDQIIEQVAAVESGAMNGAVINRQQVLSGVTIDPTETLGNVVIDPTHTLSGHFGSTVISP